MKSISIPVDNNHQNITSPHCFVITGANGSGKSRLGAWIEQNNPNTLRISAQRALTIPDVITLKDEETAWNKIYYGNETNKNKIHKWSNWNKATTQLVNDYESVLSGIFARQGNEQGTFFARCRENEKAGNPHPQTPITITDKIIDIWQNVFPHRDILFVDSKVKAQFGGNVYHGKDMSDGERVAIYLLGQCLIAPSGTILIIDEPEIHLHKSIMYKLWDKIEEYCPDKTIVYITHDLDFASSRKESTKIWVKSYQNDQWVIQILDNNDDIPDQLMMEVLGNRKNVLFVEGDKGSYDSQLYSYIYENWYVIPRHNCSKVIETTKSFNADSVKSLHGLVVKGLIDRDYMTEKEIESYKAAGIHTLEVAEVENLYLLEDIMRIVAVNQALENVDEVIMTAKEFLFQEFKKEYDAQLISMCEREIQYKLNTYSKDENTLDSLKTQLEKLKNDIDIDNIYSDAKAKIDGIIASDNLNELLKVYNRKSLHIRISKFFNLGNGDYPRLVLRLLKTDKRGQIIGELKKYTPGID